MPCCRDIDEDDEDAAPSEEGEEELGIWFLLLPWLLVDIVDELEGVQMGIHRR